MIWPSGSAYLFSWHSAGLGFFSRFLLARKYGCSFVQPLLLGGLIYSCGGVMEIVGWWTILPGVIHPHELWHVAVLIAAFLHWRFVWQFASGDRMFLDRDRTTLAWGRRRTAMRHSRKQ